jgi:outer membrane protein assembly factor BamB
MIPIAIGVVLLSLLSDVRQWNQFRGPNGSGVVDSISAYPVEFGPAKNVVWKHAIPYGQSSPIVAGGHVYLTGSEPGRLLTLCFDAASGKELWRREIKRDQFAKIFRANDPASSTPVADDDGVIVFFPDYGIAAYTAQGKDRWTVPLGPFKNFYGMAASPILSGETVILVCDQQSGSYILAVDRKTGRQRWKTDRSGATTGWATPMVYRPSKGQAQLIVLGSNRVDGYYLETGEPRWWMPIGSSGSNGTPVAVGDMLMFSSEGTGQPWMPTFESQLALYDKDRDGRISRAEFTDKDMSEHFGWIDEDSDGFLTAKEWNDARAMGLGEAGAVAFRADKAKGKIEPTAVEWRFKKNLPYIPAPLIYQGVFFLIKDGGIITALDPATGKVLKNGRNPAAIAEYYASPVAADGKVFLANVEGKMTVLKAGAEWEVLATNDLAEELHATPALSDGKIYVRTKSQLYCFGLPKP